MNSYKKTFEDKYTNLLQSLKVFFEDKEHFDATQFVDDISCFVNDLRNTEDTTFKGFIIDNWDNKDLEKSVCVFADLLFRDNSMHKHIEYDSDKLEEKANMLIEYLKDYFLLETRKSEQLYYMNLMPEECYSDFESILELIHKQLQKFDENLCCYKNIKTFLEEFDPEKMFPTYTMFLNNYLSNTFDLMVLTISKLYFDACNVDKRTNCGIKYLQSFIGKNVKDKSMIKDILKQTKAEIKSVTSSATNIEFLRNKLIAHSDLNVEALQNINVSLQDIEKIYESSCKILELLSLGYFHFKDTFCKEMIKAKGFKSFVCENKLCHKDNGAHITDMYKSLRMSSDEFQRYYNENEMQLKHKNEE